MPTQIATISGGTLEPAPYGGDSLRELAAKEPPGVYTMTRTYHDLQVVLFDAHLDRLEESAHLEGMQLKIDRPQIRAALRQMVDEADYGLCRLRITIPADRPNRPIVAIEPLQIMPPEVKAEGVVTATVGLARRNPRAKTNAWELERRRAQASLPSECYEGLLVDESGRVLEGFSSNFYTIHDSTLQTAEEGILMGISRRILLDVLPLQLELVERPVKRTELASIDEAFLTSSSRGVVPIVRVDATVIGDGRPGKTTRRLGQRYDQWVETHLEPL